MADKPANSVEDMVDTFLIDAKESVKHLNNAFQYTVIRGLLTTVAILVNIKKDLLLIKSEALAAKIAKATKEGE